MGWDEPNERVSNSKKRDNTLGQLTSGLAERYEMKCNSLIKANFEALKPH